MRCPGGCRHGLGTSCLAEVTGNWWICERTDPESSNYDPRYEVLARGGTGAEAASVRVPPSEVHRSGGVPTARAVGALPAWPPQPQRGGCCGGSAEGFFG